jgi:hypothetical protein
VSGIMLSIKHLMARPLIGDPIHFSASAHYYLADLSHFDLRPPLTTSSYSVISIIYDNLFGVGLDPANILAVDYLSDGKTLDATFWLASNLENDSIYSQPLKRIRYGMLIAIVSLPPTSGYNGANYNFYIEAVDGRWSESLPIIINRFFCAYRV